MSALVLLPVGALLGAALPLDAVSFDQAIGLALRAPGVKGAERAAAVKRRIDQQISRSPYNPQIFVQPGVRLAPSQARGVEGMVEVLHSWNLAGYAGARRKSARAEEEVLSAEARAVALERRLVAARAWLDQWGAQAVLGALERDEQTAVEFLRLVERAQRAGAMTMADLADARVYRGEAHLAVLGAEGDVYERGLALGRAAGLRAEEPTMTAGDLPSPPLPDDKAWRRMLDRVGHLPAVELRALRTRAERLRETEERAARGTLLQLGVIGQKDSPDGYLVYGEARLQMPVFDRGERERAGMAALAEQMEGEAGEAVIEGVTALAEARHEVAHTGEVLAELRDRLAPSAAEGARLRETIFRGGEGTILEVLQARRAAAAAAVRLRRAEAEHAWARVKAWLLLASVDADQGGGR